MSVINENMPKQSSSSLMAVDRAGATMALNLHKKIAFTPQLVGKASWGVLRLFWITCVYIYICDLSREKGPYAIFSRNAFYYAFL